MNDLGNNNRSITGMTGVSTSTFLYSVLVLVLCTLEGKCYVLGTRTLYCSNKSIGTRYFLQIIRSPTFRVFLAKNRRKNGDFSEFSNSIHQFLHIF